MKPRAFTLIELLVVIAVLMAILMPALGKARAQAKRTACGAHLKSLAQAGVLYAMDNDSKFPSCHMEVRPTAGSYAIWIQNGIDDPITPGGFLAHGLLAYNGQIADPKVFYCPGNENKDIKYGAIALNPYGGGWPKGKVPDDLGPEQRWIWTTYHYRSLWDGKRWRAVSTVKDSGHIAFMADMFSDPRRGVQYHHRTGYNVAYTDGHSEFIKDLGENIEDLNGGGVYFTDHKRQDYVWKTYFDKMMTYKPFQEY